MRFGALSIAGYNELTVQESAILKRFSKVFEQTYTRFLDLQKAEAREAQIEAALERVRASMMAMHKSDELLSISTLISEEMMKMGLVNEINSVSFCLIDDEKEELTLWISNLGRDRMSNTLFLPFDYEPSWAEVIKLYNKLEFFEWKEHNLIRAYEGEELIAYIDYIKLVLSDKR